MKRMLWKSCSLVAGLAMGCFGEKGGFGEPDYGVMETGYTDSDGDGWSVDEDCDDGDDTVHPEATEICDDGIDNDCDDAVDTDDEDCA